MTSIVAKSHIPSTHELDVYKLMAQQAVGSKMFKNIGDEFAVMTIMLAARELDIPPMAALNGGIHIIQGKTEISARMMAGLIMRRGHVIRVIKSTPEECTLLGIRSDNQEQCETSFTMQEAKAAFLVKDGSNWKRYPADMLYARAVSRLARRLFPDCIGMSCVEGEIRDSIAAEKPVIDECIIEEPTISDEELMKQFFSQFDTDEAREWGAYVAALREKNITLQQIISKFQDNPQEATEKMKSWTIKQLQQH